MKRTDSEIQQAVLRELKWDTRVEETDVGVEVNAGVVTLTGTVSSWAKRMAAQEAAHRVGGVLDVANDVDVHDGRVSLSGVVHSWAEREAVIGAARGTPGVRAVDDHLRIEPYAA